MMPSSHGTSALKPRTSSSACGFMYLLYMSSMYCGPLTMTMPNFVSM